ncbi:D-alanyl-D-alanine carboxypeptidase/D-alanyl-D-alanine-endopeptidase (penicillin-binding protein 4) [Bacillus oleivorans]|uniref:D-alanyl-D-alanine carboxypeptidase/D-alanyl-D-alanine-endopeptidase (Penicillin-binding protein 4) n=2 Tax=Bacillus oleivorans TaxID=1448271 RepID=A0A285CMV8_9BACI|nr:D-alanyl-D-alanine carboxypeptidase/D-alanyl-D-alanine-endopeptidase [Bacillus oleivorans]SNX68867.1 D-alanyl-D-alanine carboxypeptidase/D-alanyl-D-alanine-endopeptidase (penicillin-binding protein 4) [Bacillus oleivorans]
MITQRLNQYLQNEPKLRGAIAGISIRSRETGEILYEHHSDIRLRPASNLKLFTSAAALSVLGEDYTFETDVLTDGELEGEVLKGNLYLRGKGDPTLLPKDIDLFAKTLREQGIREIQGDLIGDDTWYDNIRYSVDLTWTDETFYYGAQVSALTISPSEDYDTGTVLVTIKPGKIGEQPTLSLDPDTDYVKIVNQAVTVAAGSDVETDIEPEREHGGNTIYIKGTIPENTPEEKIWVAVWEPTEYALALFRQSLKKYGIELKGNLKIGETTKKTKVLTNHTSIPLKELLIPFMKLSNNGHGEMLVKEMGKVVYGEGSWDKGLEVLREELEKLGVNTSTLVLRDGSGISHVNLIPAHEVSQLLFSVQSQPWFPAFLQSLPIGGEKERMVGGTLRERMGTNELQGKIKAKTGTIETVSSLSGYIDTKNGEQWIFSVILNNLLDSELGKQVEDEIVEILVWG